MERLLRRREVETLTGMSRSSIYQRMQENQFPRPISIGPRSVRWIESDVRAHIEKLIAAA